MEKISLQPLLNTLKLSNILGSLLKVFRPQSEIEDLMSSTLLGLSEGKGTAALCRIPMSCIFT